MHLFAPDVEQQDTCILPEVTILLIKRMAPTLEESFQPCSKEGTPASKLFNFCPSSTQPSAKCADFQKDTTV